MAGSHRVAAAESGNRPGRGGGQIPPPPAGKSGWPWTGQTAPLPDLRPGASRWPRISIVTPSFNQARYLEKTIRSVLLQGYPNLEYFIIDGGSTDGSVEVIRNYEKWIDGWISEPDEGQSHAINKGFERAAGELFAWLNSDDYYLPGALEAVGRAWAEAPEPVVLVGLGQGVDEAGRALGVGRRKSLEFASVIQWGRKCLTQPAVFFPAAAFREVGGLDEDLHYAMDMDLWLKLLKVVPFRHLDARVCAAHRHPDAKTWEEGREFVLEVFDVQVRHGGVELARDCLYERFRKAHEEHMRIVRKLEPFVDSPLYRGLRSVLHRLRRTDHSQKRDGCGEKGDHQ